MQTDTALSIEAIARKPLVGIDADDQAHHFDRYRDRVYVPDDSHDTITHVEDLAPGQLPAWVDHVTTERGWTDCRYHDADPVDALADHLADVLEGGAR